jgi:hypothetical protein
MLFRTKGPFSTYKLKKLEQQRVRFMHCTVLSLFMVKPYGKDIFRVQFDNKF